MTPAAVVCHGEIATSLELSADNDVRNGVALQHEGLSQLRPLHANRADWSMCVYL
jgi:hypothetical protein